MCNSLFGCVSYLYWCYVDEPSLNGRMMYPPGFTRDNNYPVLVYVYGGPYSQQVSDKKHTHVHTHSLSLSLLTGG